MKIEQTLSFKSKIKKLHKNQLAEVEGAIRTICADPTLGVRKKGDLAEAYVHKFKIKTVLHLLAYRWYEEECLLRLLHLGTHENFYRDLKH